MHFGTKVCPLNVMPTSLLNGCNDYRLLITEYRAGNFLRHQDVDLRSSTSTRRTSSTTNRRECEETCFLRDSIGRIADNLIGHAQKQSEDLCRTIRDMPVESHITISDV